MKKLVILAAGIIALAACDGSHSKRELQIQNDSLQIVLAERNAELDDIMGTFNEIQESFRQISDAENRVDLHRGNLGENSKTAKQQITSDIDFIMTQLAVNKAHLARLQSHLPNS